MKIRNTAEVIKFRLRTEAGLTIKDLAKDLGRQPIDDQPCNMRASEEFSGDLRDRAIAWRRPRRACNAPRRNPRRDVDDLNKLT